MHSMGACLVLSENSFWCPQGRAELGLGMLTWAAMDTSNGHGYSRGMQCSVNMGLLARHGGPAAAGSTALLLIWVFLHLSAW